MTKKPKAKPGTAAELAALYPGPRVVAVKVKTQAGENGERTARWVDRSITVEPLTIAELGRLIKALGPFVAIMGDETKIIEIAAQYPDEIIAAVAIGAGLPAEEIAAVDPGGFLDLAEAVFEANEDFFYRRLVPLVFARRTTAAATPGVGATPSGTSGGAAAPIPSASH